MTKSDVHANQHTAEHAQHAEAGADDNSTVRGEPGKSVRIERSRDLVTWELAAIVPLPASGQRLIDPAATTEPFLFYRAVSVP